ncbi:uncharacterized protein [Paramisgurnus dabryanus]|uniref:uncharacterized protein isoform X5 n=1 Tax=Paramisgurnus dabryanus TaxID=90735 RepID=UPI003CCF2E0B
MACAQQSAAEYLRTCRCKLVTHMENFPLIIENLYQQKVFNDHDVDALKAERTEFDKARCILDWVIKKGEMASYELLKILDFTRRRTLHPELHHWISIFSFREDADMPVYLLGTKPCQSYQIQLKKKAEDILKNQWQQNCKYLQNKAQANFSYVPLVLETDAVVKTAHCKIKMKCNKVRKLRPKKLRSYIPDKQEALTPEDLLKWKDKNILLIGKPGIGKTTVVQQILKTWTEKENKEPDYMFYFDESVLSHSSNLVNLESFLFDMNLKPNEKDRKEIFQDIEENSENVVIVFDGVSSVHKHFILKKIMNHELLPEAKIIITCRSELEDDPDDFDLQKVYVQGFSEESIRNYYQMMLGHNPDLLNVVLNNQEMFSLSYVPMYAFMTAVFFLFKNDTELQHSHTVTEMYIHIFRDALKKHGRKTLGQIDQYINEIKEQLYFMMKNAFSATEQKNLNLPEISGDQTDICSVFLKTITIRDSPTSAVTHCAFLHNTMQEFFSALWLLVNPDDIEKVLKLCQTEENKHMRYVLHFLCGLLGEHNIKLLKSLLPEDQMKKTSDWLIEKLLDTFLQPQNDDTDIDLLYVCQCLYELQSSKACLMFLEKMNHQLEPDVNLDPHQCCALSYVISQSRDKEVYLNLEDCTVSDTGMKLILSCSPKIRIKLCDEPLKEIQCLLQFFHKVSQCKQKQQKDEITTSCCCTYFDPNPYKRPDLNRALLDLYCHVKDYETETGRSFLPALQSVYIQSAPHVWIINLSERKTSILLEVLKLQTEKKPVELINCTDEESQVMSLLHCLPYISQLRFQYNDTSAVIKCVLKLFIKASETEPHTGHQMLKLLTSVCTYRYFPYEWINDDDAQSDFLLDLCSHVKDYESQTGRSLLPALQSVYIQSAPHVWIINLSERKSSILLEVLKLQTEKKPVELRDCTDEESQVMSLLHCLPYISQLRFHVDNTSAVIKCVLKLFIKASETEAHTGDQMLKLLTSVCTYRSFPYEQITYYAQMDFLLDLYSHVKDYESQTGRSLLPALQSVYQSAAPDVWIINLSKRKTSILLEVLKLQTQKKPVKLRDCTDEESQVMSLLHCLPHISQLRFEYSDDETHRISTVRFLLRICVTAVNNDINTGTNFISQLSSVCSYRTFPYHEKYNEDVKDFIKKSQSDFLLGLYSHVKDYESQTGRSLLPALQSVYQSPDVWIINLSERKTSILLEVLKLQTEKKPVKLRDCTDEESQVMSLLHCLPYISQLRFQYNDTSAVIKCVLKLFIKASETEAHTGDQMLKLLTSVCTYRSFPYEQITYYAQMDFLLDLCSHVKDYESQTGRSLLPALQSVYQSPDVWIINLSERKTSILLEVLKLQTEKKPVELIDCTDEESQVMILLHCLPYISQLRFYGSYDETQRMSTVKFLLRICDTAVKNDNNTGTNFITQLSSVCSYETFPYNRKCYDDKNQSDFLLDLYSDVKDVESQPGRSLLPVLHSVYKQSSPDVWIINLSERKTSILLEVLKLQTEKKPVKLRDWTDEESQVMSLLHCLPYISQLRFYYSDDETQRMSKVRFLMRICVTAVNNDINTGTNFITQLSSVCSYETFPYHERYYEDKLKQSDFLLDLYCHVKDYESQTGGSLLPALQSVYQSPDVWIINLSERKTSILLEVLKLQTEKKPVKLRDWTDEESQVMSLLHCLPYISQLRFENSDDETQRMSAVRFLLRICVTAVNNDINTETNFITQLSSVCSYKTLPYYENYQSLIDWSDFLLGLYSHVKDYESQTGRSLLPALQSVYQSPDVWIINLSERKTSILLEVLKLQTEKKPVKLRDCTDDESQVMSLLHCLPYISQLRFYGSYDETQRMSTVRFLLRICDAAVNNDINTGTNFITQLSSVCSYRTFPYHEEYESEMKQSDFLLDLYSDVKDYETQTGRSLLPVLQSFYKQSAPDVWIINLSERKTSILLEVLKLQTEKKPVKLRDCTDDESQVMSLLHCLPYISQLRFQYNDTSAVIKCVLKLFIKASETEAHTGDQMLKLLTSVCTYRSFPHEWINDDDAQSDFLLDLCSHVKDYESQTGRSLLPALQSVYIQSAPDVWIINLSERKTSILLEVLKLQTEKKPVELIDCTDEESQVMSLLHCLPYISQLSGDKRCVLSLVKLVQFRENPDLVMSLFQALDFNLSLEGKLPSSTCRFVGEVLHLSADKLTFTVKPQVISLRGTRLLFRRITNIHTLRLSGYMVLRIVRALRSSGVGAPISVNELSLDLNDKQRSEMEMSRVLSSLSSLLRLWTVRCLNLTECRMKSLSLTLLLCQQSPATLRLSKEIFQTLAECVYEAQEEEVTLCFLQKMGGDLTSCSFPWEKLHYFLQCEIPSIILNLKERNTTLNIREILPFLNKIHFQRMSSTFMLCLILEIYESRSSVFVFSLLSSVKNCINLQSRSLDSVHCAALRFILQHCTAVTLNMMWTSIPEEELESIQTLFSHVSCLSVDRRLLLRMIHCCSSSDVQQEASVVLLSALQHKLDFTCGSALDLTENTQTLQLTAEDCRVISAVIQRAYKDTQTLTQLSLHDCEINTAGIHQLFSVLHSVKLRCDKSILLQFLSHVGPGEAESLSQALGEEVDLSQTQLDLQVCRGLALVLDHSEGLTELDLSQCHLTDQSLDLLLPNLHKAEIIDFSGNNITDAGAQKIYNILSQYSNIKTVRLFNNRIESSEILYRDPRFEIW